MAVLVMATVSTGPHSTAVLLAAFEGSNIQPTIVSNSLLSLSMDISSCSSSSELSESGECYCQMP